MIGRVLRNFRIVSVIGEGGMGVVYLAEHLGLPKRFAIKSLSRALSGDPSFRKRFDDEARKQALLDDPSIVQVTDFFEEDGQFFLVMEYVDGQDLSRLIKARGRLSESEAVAIFRDVLKGLGFAHAKGVVHRDMKPSNVLIDKSDRARIMDFGIAIMAGAGGKGLTAAGGAIGSPWYMSPEQIERPQDVDQRSDIYALGIVLYEMLTGDVPFEGETDFSVQYQQVKSPAPDPREKNPDISAAMAQVILKAMEKAPAERFQDCGEFLQALDAIEQRKGQRRPRLVIGALVAMMIASGGTIVYLYTRPPDGASEAAKRQAEDATRRAEEATRQAEDAARRVEEAKLRAAEAAKRREDEAKRREDEAKRREDEAKRQAEDVKRREEEAKRQSANLQLQTIDVQRRNAYNAIKTASQKALLTCNQFQEVKNKEKGLRAAMDIKEAPLEQQLKMQIQDHRRNIKNGVAEYEGFLGQLARVDAPIVVEAFGEYSKSLEKGDSSSQQIRMAQLMKRDYERGRVGNKGVSEGMMEADCEAVLNKRT